MLTIRAICCGRAVALIIKLVCAIIRFVMICFLWNVSSFSENSDKKYNIPIRTGNPNPKQDLSADLRTIIRILDSGFGLLCDRNKQIILIPLYRFLLFVKYNIFGIWKPQKKTRICNLRINPLFSADSSQESESVQKLGGLPALIPTYLEFT